VDRAWYNPNYQSRWYMVSALGGLISQIVVTLLTSLSVAREREFGTFDQLLVTPLTPAEILVGKAVPPMLYGILVASALSAAGVFWFGIPFLGSMWALIVSLTVFLLSIVGVGLFISSLAATMQQALLGSFLFAMPSVLLSGLTTSIDNMPGWLRTATVINPLRWVVQILRQVFLEGATLTDVAPQLLPMAAIAAVTLTAAAVMFRKRTT
jgi:ABC-2 type transport system permease protein